MYFTIIPSNNIHNHQIWVVLVSGVVRFYSSVCVRVDPKSSEILRVSCELISGHDMVP